MSESEIPLSKVSAHCIVAVVTAKAIESLLEASTDGRYRDTHPWLVAMRMVDEAAANGEKMPLLLAVPQADGISELTHYSFVKRIDVVELHRATWETVCHFSTLQEMHPIWQSLDSLALKPAAEQVEREAVEGLTPHRFHLDENRLRPYAICETPAFLLDEGAN